ncbi:putative membrane protein [Peptoniphilus sp. ING2-D1G]|nr:putative membrane protein [Peptoniphilus sp. ING2-D1G]
MKKKITLNFILIFLVVLTIFQASMLWLQLPSDNKEEKTTEDEEPKYFRTMLRPEKAAINFSGYDHTVLYDCKDIYDSYRELIVETLGREDTKWLISISAEEYLSLMNESSIVFQFNDNIEGSIFPNLMGLENINIKEDKQLKEIYLSNDKVAISIGEEFYYVDIDGVEGLESEIASIKNSNYYPYLNFKELYDINKNIYCPARNQISAEQVFYTSDIDNMDDVYRQNLVERFLSMDIDYVNQITQSDETIYAFGQRYVKFSSDGTIEYMNNEEFSSQTLNLYTSLNNAINFITSMLGSAENLRVVDIEKLDQKENMGYRIFFNYIENNLTVYPNRGDKKNYVEVEVYSNHIKSFKQIYRKSVENPKTTEEIQSIMNLDRIVSRNIERFIPTSDENSIKNTLGKIEYISIVYIDDINPTGNTMLLPALRINYENRELYFSLRSGRFLMER